MGSEMCIRDSLAVNTVEGIRNLQPLSTRTSVNEDLVESDMPPSLSRPIELHMFDEGNGLQPLQIVRPNEYIEPGVARSLKHFLTSAQPDDDVAETSLPASSSNDIEIETESVSRSVPPISGRAR